MQESLRAVNHANERIIKEITEICNCSKSLHANDVRSGFLLLRAVFLSICYSKFESCAGKLKWFCRLVSKSGKFNKQLQRGEMLTESNSCHLSLVCVESPAALVLPRSQRILSTWFLSFRECSGESRSHWVLFCHSVVIGFNQDTSSLAFR